MASSLKVSLPPLTGSSKPAAPTRQADGSAGGRAPRGAPKTIAIVAIEAQLSRRFRSDPGRLVDLDDRLDRKHPMKRADHAGRAFFAAGFRDHL
jgi:hypothetical protein